MQLLKLLPKQASAVEFVMKRKASALLFEQRTGKTYITLGVIQRMIHNEFDAIVVSILNNKETTWADKIKSYFPQISVSFSLDDHRKAVPPKILLIHYEALTRDIKRIARYKRFNLAVVDEGQRIAKRATKQSKAVARLSWIDRRILLTGTPIEKQPTDMFAQMRFADPSIFGTNWEDFESRYMLFDKVDMKRYVRGTMAWQKALVRSRILRSKAKFNPRMMPEFVDKLRRVCLRVTKKDMGIIEPTIRTVSVKMTGTQKRCYEEMLRTSVCTTPSGVRIMAGLKITQIVKLRQIASGFIYDEDGELHYLSSAKERHLLSMIEDSRKPVVVFTAFQPDTDRIASILEEEGYRVAKVQGSTKKKLRPSIWRDFQRAQYDAIVCQIRTGGVGVDLWKANDAFVYSMGHSFIDWDQAKSRLDTITKEISSRIWVLCCKDSVDEDLFELVMIKHRTGEMVLNQLKKRIPSNDQRKNQTGRKRKSQRSTGRRS